MLERLVETFCAVDDFCKAFLPQWEAYLLSNGSAPRGPKPGLCASEIITILLMLHGSGAKSGVTHENRRVFDGMEADVIRGVSWQSGGLHVGEEFGGRILSVGRSSL